MCGVCECLCVCVYVCVCGVCECVCVCVYVQAITPISLPRVSVVDLFPNFVMKRAEEKTDSRATHVCT